MSDGLELLKPFLPGLEDVLEDPEVSEIMINGPHNVWIEGHGKLYSHEAPLLTASALNRAAIHIARPLGLDPATARRSSMLAWKTDRVWRSVFRRRARR